MATTKTASAKKAPAAKAATKAPKAPESTEIVEESALNELFIDELKDIYWAEKHLTKALAKLAKKSTTDELRSAIETHIEQTENQITRLESVFESIDEKAVAKKCEAMAGLIKESEEIVESTEDGSITRDAGIISACQKVEHYEIASYGTLKTLAGVLGYTEAVELLDATLQEEKQTDELLTQVAEGAINQSAKSEKA
ncbi:YciE/YciF ferroxidase family protein [Mucilaginibacter phyllosphaerae]|uniref:Ferritin-like domain-containing protein n=1 Tax=Mucilaginibacter phyllosphaerae TaxID=1812349 RepID=A0A4Y8ABC4_9SPHI|nr:ferritin-like domain-containing protein [Mucilaginibacter phyllosphaerae]MBB3969830.1 ferritin-like metal-binding protein YciE [Mucilaginibacter phyllosphaerae]TEW65205.1 ferritin-like domain-containing protein [Mucilaginibacter phyllosphaerae]GGH17291.1 YciE/YciF family protein [Mucilaginibacter phyllosphaerae]